MDDVQPETGILTVALMGAGWDEAQAKAVAERLNDTVLSRLRALDIPTSAIKIDEFANGYPLRFGERGWAGKLAPVGDGAFRVSRVVRISLPDANKVYLASKAMTGLPGILVYAAGYGFDRKGDQAKAIRAKLMLRMQQEAARYAEGRGMRLSAVSKTYPDVGFAEPNITHVSYADWRPVNLAPPSPQSFIADLWAQWQLLPK